MFVLDWLFTNPRRISMSSDHCPCGSSTAAMAATTWAATVPIFVLGDPRAIMPSCLTLLRVLSSSASHRFELSSCRALSCSRGHCRLEGAE